MSDHDPDIDQLWTDYKDAGTREQRDQLIVHYSPLVKYVAGRVATGLPQSVDQADMMSDIHGSSEYRANLVKVMAKRAVIAAG